MNTKFGKKMLLSLATLLIVLPMLLFGGAKLAEAALSYGEGGELDPANSTVEITIHKKDMTEDPAANYQNPGAVITNGSGTPGWDSEEYPIIKEGYASATAPLFAMKDIDEVEFQIFDVSSYFYGLRDGIMQLSDGMVQTVDADLGEDGVQPLPPASRPTERQAYDILKGWLVTANKPVSYFTTTLGLTALDTKITGADEHPPGELTFSGIPARYDQGEGDYRNGAVYIIVESDASNASIDSKPVVVTSSVNTLLALPVFRTLANGTIDPDVADVELDDIHIYPKNKTGSMYKTLTGIQHKVSNTDGSPLIPIPFVNVDADTDEAEAWVLTQMNPTTEALWLTGDTGYDAAVAARLLTLRGNPHADFEHSTEADKAIYPVAISDMLQYKITFDIPSGIDEVDDGIFVYDDLDDGLKFASIAGIFNDAMGVANEITPLTGVTTTMGTFNSPGVDPFTVDANGNDAKIFIPKALLTGLGGSKLTVVINVLVEGTPNATVPVDLIGSPGVCDEELGNTAYVNIGSIWEFDPSAKVQMGDEAFYKIDGDSKAKISGAIFQLFAKSGAGGGEVVVPLYMVSAGDATTPMLLRPLLETDTANLVADATINGKTLPYDNSFVIPAGGVWIYGLESTKELAETALAGADLLVNYGEGTFYYMKELLAPDGYILPNNDETPFDVESVAFTGVAESTVDPMEFIDIDNYHKGTLPSTGGQGIYMLLLIGLVGMVIVAILWKRNKDKETQGFDVE